MITSVGDIFHVCPLGGVREEHGAIYSVVVELPQRVGLNGMCSHLVGVAYRVTSEREQREFDKGERNER